MKGRTPNDAFSDNPIARRTAPREVLDLLLMRVERVKVSRNGVIYRGVHYGQSNLTLFRLQGQEVDIRVDPTDAAVVYVQDLEGRFITEARNERLRGVIPDDIREGARRRAAARKLAKSAVAASNDGFRTVEQHAQRLAAERVYVERQAVQRKAAGAGGQAEPFARAVELLPGAAEAARSLKALDRTARGQSKLHTNAGQAALKLLMCSRAPELPELPERPSAGDALLAFCAGDKLERLEAEAKELAGWEPEPEPRRYHELKEVFDDD
jgi:hypothetical protein